MNYSVELWNSYNKVENNLLFHLRGLKDFIYLIKEISKSFSSLSLNLKKLQEIKLNITTNESLSQGIEQFKQNIFYYHSSLEQFISKINSEIIIPLNNYQEMTLKKLNNNYKETLSSEKNYEAYLTQIDFTKDKFHSRVKQLEDKMLEKEMALGKNEDKKAINKFEEQIKENLGYAKESEKIYLSYIKYTNRIQEDYIETKKRNLNEIQNMEIDLGKNIKTSLIKFFTFENNFLKNMIEDIEQKEKLMDKINIVNDIDIYIKNNKTNDLPPYPLEYVPYTTLVKNEKIKNEIKKYFPDEKDISSLKTKVDKEIEKFLDSILEGEDEKVIAANEKNMKIVSNKTYRRIFINYLNKLRTNTNITLDDSSFKILGNLLNECLNNAYKEKDFVCIKLIIIITTNLFKLNKVSNNPRVFLHEYIKNNSVWKDVKFWENLIKYDINEEMHNQKKCYLYSEENDVLKNIRIRDIIKKQVSSNLYNMNLFEINSSLMFKIINYFSNYYALQSSVVEFLNNIVKNYQIDINQKLNKVKISIKNLSHQNSKNNIFTQEKEKEKKEIQEKQEKIETKEIQTKTTVTPVRKDEKILNSTYKEIKQTNINTKIEANLKNEKNMEENNINIYKNENIKNINIDNNKLEKKNNNSSRVIFSEGNFGNILIKESKEISGIESDDDIIDESDVNYISNIS